METKEQSNNKDLQNKDKKIMDRKTQRSLTN